MKITITRSYSQKIQVRQYEPFDAFCSAQIEMESSFASGVDKEYDKPRMKEASELLDEFCRAEVAKTIETVRPSSAHLDKVDKKKAKDVGRDSAEQDAGAEDEIPS